MWLDIDGLQCTMKSLFIYFIFLQINEYIIHIYNIYMIIILFLFCQFSTWSAQAPSQW